MKRMFNTYKLMAGMSRAHQCAKAKLMWPVDMFLNLTFLFFSQLSATSFACYCKSDTCFCQTLTVALLDWLLWRKVGSVALQVCDFRSDERVRDASKSGTLSISVKGTVHILDACNSSCLETDWRVGVRGDKWRDWHKQLSRPAEKEEEALRL